MAFKDLIKYVKALDKDELNAYKMTIIFFVVLDIFVIWWYFDLKIVGSATLIVALVLLGIVLFLERRLEDKMFDFDEPEEEEEEEEEEKPMPKKKLKKKKKKSNHGQGFNFGIPSADEYNDRLNRAFGRL